MSKRFILAATAITLGALSAAPAEAALPRAGTLTPEQRPNGVGNFTLGAQAFGGQGLVGTLQFTGTHELAEIGAHLKAPPGNFIGFFTADMYLAFIGQTGAFLPVNVMPVMGIGGAVLMNEIGTQTDINAYLYMPVGVRYAFAVGGLSLGAEALYHFPAVWFYKGASDPSRMRFELSGRSGNLFGAAYYENGAVYNGPGARVGLSF